MTPTIVWYFIQNTKEKNCRICPKTGKETADLVTFTEILNGKLHFFVECVTWIYIYIYICIYICLFYQIVVNLRDLTYLHFLWNFETFHRVVQRKEKIQLREQFCLVLISLLSLNMLSKLENDLKIQERPSLSKFFKFAYRRKRKYTSPY